MAAPPSELGPPIETKAELIATLEQGCKPRDQWRIGTEHEKFAFCRDSLGGLDYEGTPGIRSMLLGLRDQGGWTEVTENGNLIALKGINENKGGSITLEPGGQLELSGAPLETIHQTCAEVNTHLDQARRVGDAVGVGLLGLGYHPLWSAADVNWMPKGRYRIMRDYMPKRGSLGTSMMSLTCTVQVNLDFASEADMVQKMRVGLALQPVATALFANSPFTEGKPNGFQSYRSHAWTDTDPDRCGMLPFVFEDGFGFERWVDYLLDVPMYFMFRDGAYQDVAGQSFRDLMAGRLPGMPGEVARMNDWSDHMTTVFPEVRLKQFIEMRGADGGPWKRLCALPAFWTGLLYDQGALDAAWDLVKNWTTEDHQGLRDAVPRKALDAEVRGRRVADLALEVLRLSRAGLEARDRHDGFGRDESHFLDTLFEIAESGQTPAQTLLDQFHGAWEGDIRPLFQTYAY